VRCFSIFGLLPKADIDGAGGHVGFVPILLQKSVEGLREQ
jgi:hypothetical protein